jgi:hypothetical protein
VGSRRFRAIARGNLALESGVGGASQPLFWHTTCLLRWCPLGCPARLPDAPHGGDKRPAEPEARQPHAIQIHPRDDWSNTACTMAIWPSSRLRSPAIDTSVHEPRDRRQPVKPGVPACLSEGIRSGGASRQTTSTRISWHRSLHAAEWAGASRGRNRECNGPWKASPASPVMPCHRCRAVSRMGNALVRGKAVEQPIAAGAAQIGLATAAVWPARRMRRIP